MASKVLVALPQHGPFSSKKHDEVFNLGYVGSQTSNPETRVKQLEQNIRFLQENHQIMLSGLHREIETLRRRNRDLQFQMVFPKGGVSVLSPASSSSEEEINQRTASPGQVNVTPLQIELLERDLADLKTNLSESRTRNVYLQGVVDEQKKKISESENVEEKLEESDRMVRRLRRENEEQRKEIISLRMTSGKNHNRDRQRTNQYSQTSRFPPVYQNSHWNGSKNERASRKDGESSNTTLPLLKERNGPNPSNSSHHQGGNHRRGYPHHHRGGRMYKNTYRDQQEQQDC